MPEKSITIKDVARELGISKSTVSRVLQNAFDVNPETRRKVLDKMREMHYRPNMLARNLKKKSTNTIGVSIPAFDIPFYSQAIGGIQNEATRHGFNIITCQSNEDFETELKNIETLLASQVDGLLISISKTTRNVKHLLELQRNNIPVVLFNRVAGLMDFSKVYVNDFDGAYKMVNYLIEKGHKKIAHITGPRNLSLSKKRIEGYKISLEDHDIPFSDDLLIEGDFSFSDGARCANVLLDSGVEMDAIFCVCDSMALGCMQALKLRGYGIPKDIAVAGYTNDPAAEFVDPGLTTISQPSYQIGVEAAALLIKKIKNPSTPRQDVMLDTQLIVRNSA
jgi:DNA-binding LacI/PurR family transcriptional regulator